MPPAVHIQRVEGAEPVRRTVRYPFIDGLRGLAALSVLLYHAYNEAGAGRAWLPAPLHVLFSHGFLGVEVFFVISGFVIARNIDEAWVTPGYFGRFFLRRSLRLDPPYFSMILLTFTALHLEARLFGGAVRPPPAVTDVLLNFAYLDNITGARSIVKVGWSLCLEIQFYLVLLLLTAVSQRLLRTTPYGGRALALLFLPLFAFSLPQQYHLIAPPAVGLFMEFWCMFFAGTITWWAVKGVLSTPLWGLFLSATVAPCMARFDIRAVFVVAAAVGILVASRTGHLHTLFASGPMKYFGRISYSLYLLHPLPLGTLFHAADQLMPGIRETRLRPVLLAASLALAVGLSHLFHLVIERPALRWSQKIRLDRARSGSALS
jgi:peptidoglycan/LPS O-acetylase OafA/YrhL